MLYVQNRGESKIFLSKRPAPAGVGCGIFQGTICNMHFHELIYLIDSTLDYYVLFYRNIINLKLLAITFNDWFALKIVNNTEYFPPNLTNKKICTVN